VTRGALRAALVAAALGAPAALAQAPDATVSSLTLFVGKQTGLYRTNDWGSTWQQVRGASPGDSLEAVGAVTCLVPLGPQMYIGTATGIYLSLDFGETWRRVSDQADCTTLLPSRFPQADPTVFLGTPKGLLRSGLDRFESHEDANRLFAPTALRDEAVFKVNWPGPALIAATASGLRLSLDGGAHFVSPKAALPDGPVTALAVSSYYASDPALLVGVGDAGVLRTADGGETWLPAGLKGRSVRDLYWLGPLVYAATDAGVFRSDDLGATWSPLNKGIEGRGALAFLFPLAPASGAEIFLATDAGLYWTGDGGLNWSASGESLGPGAILSLGTFPAPDRALNLKRKK
jgi:photosystem II stability/assembly factor-like uncharacterized protein